MIHGVLFDKDDTLLDLATFWRAPVQRTVDFMLRELRRENDQALRHALECAAGFDGDALIAESPGRRRHQRRRRARLHGRARCAEHRRHRPVAFLPGSPKPILRSPACCDGVCQPTGDLAHVLDALHAQNIRTGVATSDSFASTMHALEKMGVARKI